MSHDGFSISLLKHRYKEPEIQDWILQNGSREQIIEWLVWNDANGVYTDEDSNAEGWLPMTLESARETMARAMAESE